MKESRKAKLKRNGILGVCAMFVLSQVYTLSASSHEKVCDEYILSGTEYNSNGTDLLKKYDEDSALCKKLLYDYEEDTGILDEGVERQLNAIGVFDSEIAGFDEETIEGLNAGQEYSVSISYATEEDDGEMEGMNQDDIDEVIEEEYTEEVEAVERDLSYNVLSALDSPATALAKVKSSPIRVSESGAMKQVVVCVQMDKKAGIWVTYTATWLKEPVYRDTDVFGVSLDNATPITSTWTGEYTYTVQDKYIDYKGKHGSRQISYAKKLTCPIFAPKGVAKSVDLYSSRSELDVINASSSLNIYPYTPYTYFKEHIINESLTMNFQCTIDDRKTRSTIVAAGHYKHSKKKNVVSPSISIATDGLSVGFSVSDDAYFQEITNNAMLTFYFK